MFYFIKGLSVFRIVAEPCADRFLLLGGLPVNLSRAFFLFGDFSIEKMFALMKSKVAPAGWHKWMENLIKDSSKSGYQLLYIFKQEILWDRYMDYLKSNPTRYQLEDAPKEVRDLYKDDFIRLYAKCVESHFQYASDRNSYRDGALMLTKLIEYGGRDIALRIISQQKNRRLECKPKNCRRRTKWE